MLGTYGLPNGYQENYIRQFVTSFSTSDWFLAMLTINTEHGSGSSANVKLCLGNSKQH